MSALRTVSQSLKYPAAKIKKSKHKSKIFYCCNQQYDFVAMLLRKYTFFDQYWTSEMLFRFDCDTNILVGSDSTSQIEGTIT